ncbi:cytosine methyltransferase, partial [Salmonella enterica subsp. enterica serovar Typhimurium]
LQKVIDGEQGGVSKETDWQGGGSFVYAELQELNQIYVDRIQQVSSKEDLPQVIDDMKEQALLDFKKDLEKVSIENEDFAGLSLKEQKALLINVLDENQL